jgi:diguanylate cyclase (GGDEF)-like protein
MFSEQQHAGQSHLVQFYDDDDYLIDGLADYIGTALADGNKGIAVATREHLDRLALRLRGRGLDVQELAIAQRYVPLEAERLLPLFMADGLPDKARFRDVIGSVIARAAGDPDGHVFVFGELVAILAGSERCTLHALGKHQAAIHVEHFFNELQRQYPFTLLCAYPMSAFPREEDRGTFSEVCALHSHVLPAENVDLCASADALQRSVAGLQQQAYALSSAVYDRKQVERALREVNVDRLTGLPNRSVFNDRLDMDIRKSERTHLPVALLFIDLDHFKEINDTLGHATGDLLLKQVGQRLASHVRKSDTVTRLGGDEFTITLAELHDVDTVTDVAQNILDDLARPFHIGNEMAYISASIGITLYPQDAGSAGELLRNADQAMYESKNQGRNRLAYFTPSMQQAAQARMSISKDLRRALGGQELRVHYQPIVDLRDGRICKAEALLRWYHPVNGEIAPEAFIPVAEHTGMIVAIGNWVFGEALKQATLWRLAHPDFSISVNVSPVQFYRNKENSCRQWLDNLRSRARLPGGEDSAVNFEITEGLLLSADDDVISKLAAFQNAGIKISLDDFGTGYSSLSYLRKFNVDFLKIDQSFVVNLENDPANVALCEAIIVMAHKLGLKVIAEGVETAAQRDLLQGAGCDYGQGFHFGYPIDAAAFETLLRVHNSKQAATPLRYN